jgi:hypothetical protein
MLAQEPEEIPADRGMGRSTVVGRMQVWTAPRARDPRFATSAHATHRRGIGSTDAAGANRSSGSCKHESGHDGVDVNTAAVGVKEPRASTARRTRIAAVSCSKPRSTPATRFSQPWVPRQADRSRDCIPVPVSGHRAFASATRRNSWDRGALARRQAPGAPAELRWVSSLSQTPQFELTSLQYGRLHHVSRCSRDRRRLPDRTV